MGKERGEFTRFDIDSKTGEKKYNWEMASERPLSPSTRLAKFGLQAVWKENLGQMFGEVMKIKEGEDYKGSSKWSPGKHLRQRMIEKFGEDHPWVKSCSDDPGYTDSEFALAVIHKQGLIRAIPLIMERIRRDGARHETDPKKRRALEKQTPRRSMPVPWRALAKAWREVPAETEIYKNSLRRAATIIVLVPVFPWVDSLYGLEGKQEPSCHSATATWIAARAAEGKPTEVILCYRQRRGGNVDIHTVAVLGTVTEGGMPIGEIVSAAVSTEYAGQEAITPGKFREDYGPAFTRVTVGSVGEYKRLLRQNYHYRGDESVLDYVDPEILCSDPELIKKFGR